MCNGKIPVDSSKNLGAPHRMNTLPEQRTDKQDLSAVWRKEGRFKLQGRQEYGYLKRSASYTKKTLKVFVINV